MRLLQWMCKTTTRLTNFFAQNRATAFSPIPLIGAQISKHAGTWQSAKIRPITCAASATNTSSTPPTATANPRPGHYSGLSLFSEITSIEQYTYFFRA
jgi:hypothetical protein